MRASQLMTATARSVSGGKATRLTGPAPLVLERYRLHRRLGSGAFGTVWMAHDERLDREVAVKVLARERVVGGRFEREARAAARLAHPGIVTLYEAAVDDEGAYLVSELVRGATFEQLLSGGRLSDRDIIAIGIAIADALAHAHAHGVVHRDVKPSNILVPEQPVTAAQVAKLTDFGVARVVGGDSLTLTGDVIGTLAYMAPEQAEGREATESADLYSLALVIYEALTGVNPVRAATAAQRARRLGAYLPPLRRQRRDLPRELGQAIDLALRPRPRERGGLEHLGAALTQVQDRVADQPGIVTGGWTAAPGRHDDAANEPEPLHRSFRAAPDRDLADQPDSEELPVKRIHWPERALAAAAAAVTAGWVSAQALAPPPVAPTACALLAGALVLIVPRLGWLALTLLGCATAILQQDPGAALVLLIAALVPVAALPRWGWSWPVASAAAALGFLGLGGAWPALAARAKSTWQRAGLAAAGWLWLALAGPLAGRALYLPSVPGTVGRDTFGASVSQATGHLLAPLLASGVLLGAGVWAVGAAMLPFLVRGRSLGGDLARGSAWAGGLAAGTGLALAFPGSHAAPMPPTAVAGALAGLAVAIAPTAVRAWRANPRSHRSQPRLP
jgi:serine/threonine protein kinase